MTDLERQTIREVRYVDTCGWWSPVVCGVALVAIGVVTLLPDDLSRYMGPAVAIVAGLWLIFGRLGWRREVPYGRIEDPFDRR